MTRDLVVWIDDWQWQCCGEPFDVGDEVDWTMSDQPDRAWLVPVIGDLAAEITHAEDHHGGLPNAHSGLTGKVRRIRAVSSRYGPDPDLPHENAISPVPGTGQLEELEHADGRYRTEPGLRFVGYVVDLQAT